VSDAPKRKPLPNLSKHPDLLPKRKRLDPVKAAEFRRQGRLFFGAALFFGLSAIMLLGIMALNKNPGSHIVIISVVAMAMSAASLIYGIVRLCQAAGANQGCATILAILVGAVLTFAMVYQLIWFFFLRKLDGDNERPVPQRSRDRSALERG